MVARAAVELGKKFIHPITKKMVYRSQFPTGISGLRERQLFQNKVIDKFLDKKVKKGIIRQKGPILQKEIKDKFNIDISMDNLNKRLRFKQGAQKASKPDEILVKGSPLWDKVKRWLVTDKRYEKLTAPKIIDQIPELNAMVKKYGTGAQEKWYKHNLSSRVNDLRKELGLEKKKYSQGPFDHALRKFRGAWRTHLLSSKYPRVREMGKKLGEGRMDAADMARYAEDFKTALAAERVGVGELGQFTDDEIKAAMNVVEDTIATGRDKPMHMFGADLDYAPYTSFKQDLMSETTRNLEAMPRGEGIMTVGHSQKTAYQRPYGMGSEMSRIEKESWNLNTQKLDIQKKAQLAIDRGDMASLRYYHNKLKNLNLRAEMEMEAGNPLFIGRGALTGKYAGGGLIKKGLKKLLGDSLGMMSRRKFLKGMGATAASAALPKGVLKLAAPVSKVIKGNLPMPATTPPWIQSMVGMLRKAGSGETRLSNGTVIDVYDIVNKNPHAKGTYGQHTIKQAKITTADGYSDDISFSEGIKDINIDFNIADEWHNNQHIVIDKGSKIQKYDPIKKKYYDTGEIGETTIIDDNYYMTSPEDYAKDDWIEWDVGKKSLEDEMHKKTMKYVESGMKYGLTGEEPVGLVKPRPEITEFDKMFNTPKDVLEAKFTKIETPELRQNMILAKGDEVTDAMFDEWSVPFDSDYSTMFERYVDSFSPSGNIFNTKEAARQWKKKQALEKKLRGEREMDRWEEQFRGGHGMHGYKRGGMPKKLDKRGGMPKKLGKRSDQAVENSRMTRLRNMSDVEAMARMMHAESSPGVGNERDARAIGHVIQNRAGYKGPESTYGLHESRNLSPIKRVLAGQNQFTPYRSTYNLNFWDFDMTEKHPYYQYAKQIMLGQADDFTEGATMFDLDPNKYNRVVGPPGRGYTEPGYNKYWNFNPSKFEHEGPHSFWGITPRMNKGGLAKKFSVDDAVAMIKASPQKFQGGGLVKLFAPKVMGKLSKYSPKITGKGPDLSGVRSDLYTPPKGPYTLTDESGVRILEREFQTLEGAQLALDDLAKLRTQDASTFKIFGKRPPKTAEGVSEGAPEVNLGMVGKKLPPEKPGAMFWGSREKIIHAPSESMTGKQWLQYLQLPKHGILNPKGFPVVRHMELNDTGLAPHLSKLGNKTVSKEQLVKDFDTKLAPELDVTVLGSKTGEGGEFYKKMQKMDLQPYREGPLKNVLKTIKDQGYPFKEALANNNTDEIMRIIKVIDDSAFNNFGVANPIMQGFPQKFPFELKKVLQEIAQLSGARTAGFRKYAKESQYGGQQTLGGGQNYREFLFKYKQPKGSLRETEPVYNYAHEFGLSSSKREGGFVHMRTSDRTDEYGRRILHIEEIQSDMHQNINSAQRAVKRTVAEGKRASASDLKDSKYAPRGDMIAETVDKANEQHLALLASKIEDLAAQPQTKAIQTRLVRLNKERAKVRKMIADKRAKMAEGEHSGVPQGPYSKTEDYNEFVMKYATKVAQEGGYDGVTISSSAIKNRKLSPGNTDYGGNVVAYGPMAEGAMKKVAKKSGAKYLKTSIIDDKGRGWEVPLIWLDDQAKFSVARGMPAYKRGGMAVNG